ncbi:hypothetical protein ASE69_18405 [Sphingomonas sp. Leaf208]|uniref:sarcosine oxidase subunit gamma n=1 Tax=Sphingomonas sp. Leaf208 TaxID=1735679 RepID=UPI0006F96DE0|nr:sarcosine oxidase subunit gamma family protein [Sphingomonas sp. Leaf208]KQM54471.1 hypothetical protein ASE69_18405 [Sphingomonas sp. Leaf208]
MVDDPWRVAAQNVTVARISTPALHLLRLRGFDDAVLGALDRCLSTELPRVPNHAVGTDPRAIAIAPGEWMLVGSVVPSAALLAAASGARVAHVADLGEGRVVYAVAGPRARDLVAKGCTIDLHPRVFGPSRAAQSALAQVFVVIDQPSEEAVFHIYADASYVQHLDLWFADAVLEFQTQDTD